MATIQKRGISLLLVLMLILGMIPSVSATEIDTQPSTEPAETITPVSKETLAAETSPPEATQPEETSPPETTQPVETLQPETTEPEQPVPAETTPEETEPSETEAEATDPVETQPVLERPMLPSLDMAVMAASNDGIATIADAEIIGNPTTFASLFLWDAIYIPSFNHIQRKEHIPLYSVYLKNQPGYENNYYIAYCIEPGIEQSASANYDGNSSTLGNLSGSSTMYTYLSPAQVKAMGVVLMYGQMEIARRADAESVRLEKLRRWAATQLIIWEIAAGWRSSSPPYACSNSTLYDAVTPTLEIASSVWNNSFMLSDITSAYDDIEEKIAKHFVVPSFASEYQSNAPIYDLTPTSSGGYTITLTDTNNILSEYTFTNTDQVKYSVSGNKLTITVSGSVSGDITISPTKNVLNLDKQVFWFWEKGSNQRMMSCKTVPDPDPDPCYFTLRAATNGRIELTKTTEDGQNLSGWQFGFYSDGGCTNLISGPHTTDANGRISVDNLTAGVVYVKELGHTDSAINDLYYCSSANPQTVVVTAGEAARVSFRNMLNTGEVKIVKRTNTGENLSGWDIALYYDAACTNKVSDYPFTTDENGIIIVTGLKPGTIYAKELPTDDPYWESDTAVKEVKIVANQVSTVTFTNTHYGRIKFQKTTNTGNHLGGWTFRVTDTSGNHVGDYTTDETGEAYTGNLPFGNYKVQEISAGDDFWNCEIGIHDVTVKAGETVVDSWLNRELGLGWFYKRTNTGEDLTGWEITVYSDEACTKEVCIVNPVEDGKVGYYFEPGTYYAKETGDMFGRDEDGYWVMDASIYRFEIKPHEETSVTFTNTHYGKLNICKTMDTVGPLDGWQFRVTDGSGKEITGSPFTSDKNGEIHVGNVLPGMYKVEELIPEDSLYYCKSENPQTVTVKRGETAEVSFTNALRFGKLNIRKTMDTDGPLDGWQFRVTDASGKEIAGSPFTSDKNGEIHVGDVLPGVYKVEELIPEDSLYFCKSENPQTVTVKQGETAEVSFTNALRPGKITVEKVDLNGEHLTGAKFLLEWSEDGSLWCPIEYSDSKDVIKGYCSNPDVIDGTLTTDLSGIIEWNNLHPGLYYRITELEAPEGYVLLTEAAYEDKLPTDDLEVVLRVINCEAFTLPKTGSGMELFFLISRILCIAVCGTMLLFSFRKKRRA